MAIRAPQILCVLFLSSTGCLQYGFSPNNDARPPEEPTRPSASVGGGVDAPVESEDTAGPAEEETGEEETIDTDTSTVPEASLEGCPKGTKAVWKGGEVYVADTDTAPVTGVMVAPLSGYFDLYDTAPSESGAKQQNESMFLRVPNATNPEGLPELGNCGEEWVVLDADNEGPVPEGTVVYLGTFWLDAGENTVEMHHYCWLWEQGQCTDMYDEDTPCFSDTYNSTHLLGDSLCLVASD